MGAMARRLEAPQEIHSFGVMPDIEQWAADELSSALGHDWLELAPLAPFADVIECDPARGCPYAVVRSYSWAGVEGGDIVCEVTVYASPDRRGHFVRRRCVIEA
jgi:hypothetical protein